MQSSPEGFELRGELTEQISGGVPHELCRNVPNIKSGRSLPRMDVVVIASRKVSTTNKSAPRRTCKVRHCQSRLALGGSIDDGECKSVEDAMYDRKARVGKIPWIFMQYRTCQKLSGVGRGLHGECVTEVPTKGLTAVFPFTGVAPRRAGHDDRRRQRRYQQRSRVIRMPDIETGLISKCHWLNGESTRSPRDVVRLSRDNHRLGGSPEGVLGAGTKAN